MKGNPEISLCQVTRARLHEYYKDFVSDPDIFMDMSRFSIYQYDPRRIDAYFDARKPSAERRDFMVLNGSAVIGELSLKHINEETGECELSIHLQNNSVKNKGYGTIAEKLALKYAFETLNLKTVLADATLKNKRSQHVLEKVGSSFVREDDIFRYYRCERASFYQNDVDEVIP